MSALDTEGFAFQVLGLLEKLEKKIDQVIAQTSPRPPADDEAIGRDPSEKYWGGESYKGCRMSECSPSYLRAYAKYRAACAWACRKNDSDKPEKLKYADRDEKSAKLAGEWADYREAMGYRETDRQPEAPAPTEMEADIPF